MFILKKIITPLLLPPGLLVIIGLAFFFRAMARKDARCAWTLLSLSALIWIFSSGPASNFVMGTLESGLNVPPEVRGDVIIMLGGAVLGHTDDFSGKGAPGYGTMERMVTAARLHRRYGWPIIVSGGRMAPHEEAIAVITKRFLMDLGIPSEQILTEAKSRDTYENALYSKALCERYGFKAPILVTTGYHMKRSLFCFHAVGLEVTPYPCALTVWPEAPFGWRRLLPTANNLQGVSSGLHEWIGRLYYRLRY